MSQEKIVNCKEVIKAADKVIASKNKQIKLSDLALKQSQEESERLAKIVKVQDDKLSSIFRNPYVLIGLGAILGGLVFKK